MSAATSTPEAPSTVDRAFNLLLAVCLPGAVLSHFFLGGTSTFILCALALLPLARLMGEATEVVAHHLCAGLGGLMNASFGNAAELIIAIAALRSGQPATARMCCSNWLVAQASSVQWPELWTRGAISFATSLPRRTKNSIVSTPT